MLDPYTPLFAPVILHFTETGRDGRNFAAGLGKKSIKRFQKTPWKF